MRLCAPLFLLFFSFAAMAQRPFITKWKINSTGEKITIRINPDVTGYNYNVNWGDGTSSTGQTASADHYYGDAGTYTVSITGDFPAIHQGSLSDPDLFDNAKKLIAIEQWGDMVWKSMEGAFFGAQDLVLNASDIPNLSNVTSLEDMFSSATNFIGSAGMKDWDVSHIMSMRNMFIGTEFNQDIGDWDVSQVKNMAGLFTATPFNQDVSGWDVSRVEDMNNMFVNNPFFNQDISGWNVGQVKNMGSLFRNAVAFNQDISSWDVSNVTDMQSMFRNAGAFDQNLSQWDIQAVNNMFDAFGGCGLSKANYDATLIGWASQANIQSNVLLGSLGLTFCAGADARQYLIDEYGWDITGDSPACQSMLIFVKKEDGKTLTLEAEGSDAIQQLKQKIQDKSGIAVNMQRLFFNDVELQDGRTLADYGIGNGSTIELILSTNRAPIAVVDELDVTENTPATGNVLTNDSDPDGNVLTASLVTAPVNGTVVLNADGSFTYTPNNNYSGLDSLTYQVCDNGVPSLCDTAQLYFTIVDDIAPIVTSVVVPTDGYYREAGQLEFAVNFSENVLVVGTPYIPVTIGSTVRMAQYSTGLGTNQLVFSYTVQAGEVDMDGVALGTTIHLNGGTIRDAAQNNAVLALQSIAPTNHVLVNAVHPTVTLSTAMTLVNTPFSVAATFSEAVTGFSITDIGASNATISNLQTVNNITYSFLVTPTDGGLVQLSLSENVAVNIAANGNTASNVLNVQYNKMITGISLEDATFVYNGTARSIAITGTLQPGTTVSYQNNSRTDVGTQEVTATVRGANYQDLVLKANLTISKAEMQNITLAEGSFVYDGTAKSLLIAGTLPEDGAVSYIDNGKVDAGTYTVTANINGGTNYRSTTLSAKMTIQKAAQTIRFNSPGVLGRDAGQIPLDVSASSGLPIHLTVDNPTIANVSGGNLQVHRLGTVTVTAIQEGDANHEPAEAVSLKIRIAATGEGDLPVRVHKAVSPNGDGINEFLVIEGIEDFSDNKVTIFDKSGRVLQEIEGYDNKGWVFTGEDHRDGTYYYYIDVNDGGEWKREKGFFVIRR